MQTLRKKTLKRRSLKRTATSTTKADILFSKWIRERDGKCVRCGRTTSLQCSHFWPRDISATRYDPDNCDTLCYACHYGNNQGWERAKQGEYRYFKINQLGISGYELLEERAKKHMKRSESIANFLSWYEKK